jgi:hypothetical protein
MKLNVNVKIIDLNCSFKAKTVFISLKAENYFLLLKFFVYFFGGLQCVGHSFAYVAHFVFLRDIWNGAQRAAVANRRATNLATHLPTFNVGSVKGLEYEFGMRKLLMRNFTHLEN